MQRHYCKKVQEKCLLRNENLVTRDVLRTQSNNICDAAFFAKKSRYLFSQKSYIVDVRLGSKYASDCCKLKQTCTFFYTTMYLFRSFGKKSFYRNLLGKSNLEISIHMVFTIGFCVPI